MLRATRAVKIGTLSTALASGAVFVANAAQISDPFYGLTCSGALFRAATLPLSLYGDSCLARMAGAVPDLQEATKTYEAISLHPRAILWEKKVAAQKLKNDRERIFREHRTGNVRMSVPHIASMLMTWYALCIPSQQISALLDAGSPSWQEAVDSSVVSTPVSHITEAAWPAVVDPTLTVAMSFTLFNTVCHLRRRRGFNDHLDTWLQKLQLGVGAAWVVAVSCELLFPAFFPAYMGPVWLGVSLVGLAQNVLINGTAPLRALCRIPDYPASHGTYGNKSTAEHHEYRLMFTGVDHEERRDMWETQKKALDYECDVRLHRMFKSVGLFDAVEEAEHEKEILDRKLGVARQRRRERMSNVSDGVGVTPEAFDKMQERENEKRQRRREGGGGSGPP